MVMFLIYLYIYGNFDPFPLQWTKTNLICDENTLMQDKSCRCNSCMVMLPLIMERNVMQYYKN